MGRILYVWNYREWGGAQIYYLSLMKEAGKSNSVSAVIPSDSDPKILQYLASLEIPVEFSGPAPLPGGGKSLLGKLSGKIRHFRSENRLVSQVLKGCGRNARADCIVHIDLGFWISFVALTRLCRKTNVFVTQHTALIDPGGIRGLLWRAKGKLISRFPNFVVLATNNAARKSLKPFLSKRKFDAIPVTYSGIEPTEFDRLADEAIAKADICNRYSLPLDRPLVMAVGQFVERKGCWIVLEALRKLRDAGEELQFVWLGTSRPADDVIERIESYGLADAFRLMDGDEIGPTRHDLLSLLSAADIFVLASLMEGLPIALTEAMALGLPCIATNVGAIPEAIDHEATGVLIPPGDAPGLADAIVGLLHDREQRSRVSQAAKAVAFEKFNQKITAERTMRIYDNLWKTSG